jgi:chitinase
LSNIPKAYSVINFAFLDFDASGNVQDQFDAPGKAFTLTKADVHLLQAEGRSVLISIGGGAAPALQCSADSLFVSTLSAGIISVVDKYGFDGVDFDIEHRSGSYVGCAQIISTVISNLKANNPSMQISMAPQMPNLFPDLNQIASGYNELAPLVSLSLSNIDRVQPQMYNTYPAAETVSFAQAYTQKLVTGYSATDGTTTFNVQVPLDKIILGFPASPSGAGSGFIAPSDVAALLTTVQCGGIMTWSIGWDQQNNWAFAAALAPVVTPAAPPTPGGGGTRICNGCSPPHAASVCYVLCATCYVLCATCCVLCAVCCVIYCVLCAGAAEAR